LLEVSNLGLERSDQRRLLLGDELKGGDLFGQLLIRGRVIKREVVVRWNSPRYARCFPRWWIVGSGHLNSYELAKQVRAVL